MDGNLQWCIDLIVDTSDSSRLPARMRRCRGAYRVAVTYR